MRSGEEGSGGTNGWVGIFAGALVVLAFGTMRQQLWITIKRLGRRMNLLIMGSEVTTLGGPLAYDRGPLTLVSASGSTQPLFIVLFVWGVNLIRQSTVPDRTNLRLCAVRLLPLFMLIFGAYLLGSVTMKKLAIVFVSLLALLSFNHSPQAALGSVISWKEIPSPGNVEEIVALDGFVFARTAEAVFRSQDCGNSWEPLPIGLNTGPLHAMDADSPALYLGSQKGVVISTDFGNSFSWSLPWGWDDARDVDFNGGYGWAAIDMWGSRSGPNYKATEGNWELRRGNIPWGSMSMTWVVADPLTPDEIAYVAGIGKFRTLDGGKIWTPIKNRVLFTTILGGKRIAFGSNEFSEDHGTTWQSLGITANTLIKDDETGLLFVGKSGGGVYTGHPKGWWNLYGLLNQNVRSLAICQRQLLAVSTEGKIFQTDIVEVPTYYLYLPLVKK